MNITQDKIDTYQGEIEELRKKIIALQKAEPFIALVTPQFDELQYFFEMPNNRRFPKPSIDFDWYSSKVKLAYTFYQCDLTYMYQLVAYLAQQGIYGTLRPGFGTDYFVDYKALPVPVRLSFVSRADCITREVTTTTTERVCVRSE